MQYTTTTHLTLLRSPWGSPWTSWACCQSCNYPLWISTANCEDRCRQFLEWNMQGLTSHSHFDAASEKKFSFTLIQRDSQCFKQKSSYTASQKHTFKKRLLTSVTADANFVPSGKGVKKVNVAFILDCRLDLSIITVPQVHKVWLGYRHNFSRVAN